MPDEPAPTGTGVLAHDSGIGKTWVGLGGVVFITAYLVLFALVDFYVIVKVWPPDPLPGVYTTTTPPGNQPTTAPGTHEPTPQNVPPTTTAPANQTPTATAPAAVSTTREITPIKWQINFPGCRNDAEKNACWISLNTSLFLIALLSGALGSLLHSLRSFYWYAGNRRLVWSWALMYMLLPFSGAVLATIFYIIIRAGFLPSSGATPSVPNTPFGFAALGALVGLFSEQAVLKLKQVAETVFTKSTPGKDHAAPPPKVASISPNTAPAAGGTAVAIAGADFAAGAKVTFGGTPATAIASITTTSINATTPPHDPGQVDVEVVNADGQKGLLTGGYKYV